MPHMKKLSSFVCFGEQRQASTTLDIDSNRYNARYMFLAQTVGLKSALIWRNCMSGNCIQVCHQFTKNILKMLF